MSTKVTLLASALSLLAASAIAAPAYNAGGDLIPPADYREWAFLSAGLDMSYSENASAMDHSMFDNVFVDPVSWAAFKQSGHWPDKT
jgi:hypothetical protein